MGLPSVARSAAPTGGVAALPWNQWQDSPGIGGSFAVISGSFRLESAAGLLWNQWQLSCGTGGSFAVESVAGFTWNRWQLCRGISGRIHLESVAALPWNTHPAAWVGWRRGLARAAVTHRHEHRFGGRAARGSGGGCNLVPTSPPGP